MPEILEQNKKPGVCYALTSEGLELPVIDITHPAFAFEMGAAEVSALIDQFVASLGRLAQLPPGALQGMLQNSLLMRGMMVDSAGTYTTGLMTYLNKLGPDNLGAGFAGPLDRQWAASLTPVTFRWRMRDVARLLAAGLKQALANRPGAPVRLVNIGGGPAADSFNALILLHKAAPGLLAGRPISIQVFDLDGEGPQFGARALAALAAPGGPLEGLEASLEWIPYNWADPACLYERMQRIQAEGAAAAGSSEGGLFEFASDAEIAANLAALRSGAGEDFVMAGPVVRDAASLDPRLRAAEHAPGRPAIRFIGLEAFGRLARAAGWQIAQVCDGPMHQVVSLRPAVL